VKRSRRALIAASAVGLVVIVLVAVFATEVAHPPASAKSPLLGKVAPAISGKDLLTGQTDRLAALRGRYVLVSFFASWCQPCNAEVPQLESFLFDHHSNVAVLGVLFDDSAANAVRFLHSYGASWEAVTDPATSVAVSYGVADPPQSILVSPEGQVVAWFPGAVTLQSLNASLAAEIKTAKANA